MEIRIEPIQREQKSVFMQMMELYMYDFTEFSDEDIKAIKINFIKFEQFAFTEDLEHFAFSTDELVRRFPRTKIIRVKGFRAVPADEPLDPNVII